MGRSVGWSVGWSVGRLMSWLHIRLDRGYDSFIPPRRLSLPPSLDHRYAFDPELAATMPGNGALGQGCGDVDECN